MGGLGQRVWGRHLHVQIHLLKWHTLRPTAATPGGSKPIALGRLTTFCSLQLPSVWAVATQPAHSATLTEPNVNDSTQRDAEGRLASEFRWEESRCTCRQSVKTVSDCMTSPPAGNSKGGRFPFCYGHSAAAGATPTQNVVHAGTDDATCTLSKRARKGLFLTKLRYLGKSRRRGAWPAV